MGGEANRASSGYSFIQEKRTWAMGTGTVNVDFLLFSGVEDVIVRSGL